MRRNDVPVKLKEAALFTDWPMATLDVHLLGTA
jgi:hypothetical protein